MTSFSIEIFKTNEVNDNKPQGCLNNEYGVQSHEIIATLNRLIAEIPFIDLMDGLEISIQKEH